MPKPITTALIAAVAALAVPLGAATAPQTPGTRSTKAITGGLYQADPAHTQVVWTVDHLGFTPYSGMFGNVTGTLQLDPKHLATAKVDVSIPVAQVTTTSPGLTAHLLRAAKEAGGKPDFFGPAPAPARFVSTKVKVIGNGRASIAGQLTLNGVTKPVVLETTFFGAGKMPAAMGGKENVGFTARATIMRSDYGLMTALPMVPDAVTLDIAAAFQK